MPLGVAALAVLLVYRRLRRLFGRQPLRPVRMRLRIGILVLLGCSLLPAAMHSASFMAAVAAGLIAGIALGVWGARMTRYVRRDEQLYYVPHTYSGMAVSLLLVGRLVYRMVVAYSSDRAAGDAAELVQSLSTPIMFKSPLTVAMVFIVIGYYISYYGWILWKANRIGPEDLEVSATPNAVSSNEYGGSSPGR